jgi:hypothetical protein
MTKGAAALFMQTAYQQKAIYFGDTPLGRRCFSRVANTPDVIVLGQWWQRISLSFLGVRDDVGFDAEAG